EEYWGKKEISLQDIALSVGTAFLLVIIAFKVAEWFGAIIPSGEDVSFFFNLLNGLFGDNYLVLTTFTFIALALFPKYFESINGSQEIGRSEERRVGKECSTQWWKANEKEEKM